jgi:hypothetical protein
MALVDGRVIFRILLHLYPLTTARRFDSGTKMKITAMPPTTPPAIAPAFEQWPTRMGDVGNIVEEVLEVVVGELALEEDVGATDALEGLRIAQGASSRLSIKRSGVRTRSGEGTKS